MATSLKQDLQRLRRLKDESTALNKKAKDKSAELEQHQARVYARMESEDVESIRFNGRNFIRVEPQPYASIQDRDAFVEWARNNDPSLVSEKEEKRLLNQLVRERLDNGEELPPGIGFYTKEIISVRAG